MLMRILLLSKSKESAFETNISLSYLLLCFTIKKNSKQYRLIFELIINNGFHDGMVGCFVV